MVFRGDQEEGRECHDLPTEQEHDAVPGNHEQRHAGGQQAVKKPQFLTIVGMLGLLPVAQAVDVTQQRDQKHRHEKKGRQAVHGHAEFGTGDGPRQRDGSTFSGRPEPDDAPQTESRPKHGQKRRHPLSNHRRPPQKKAGGPARRGNDDSQEHQQFAHNEPHQPHRATQARANTTMTIPATHALKKNQELPSDFLQR